uniref:ANK_REP_REGION domain-containing protein n=1 Tax=Anopheles dirus TaxID=7168 RepID=A0A182NDE9_9DIPT
MYLPAGYDDSDDDDFDDFGYICSSYPGTKPKPPKLEQTPTEDYDALLYNAILDDDLAETKRIIEQDEYFRCGGTLRQGWPALFYACFEAKQDIVEYLVQELQIDVNRQYSLQTALMIACSSTQPTEQVFQVVRLLLDNGAIIGVLDQYGCSPLMFACKEGHLAVVKEIVAESSLLSADNEGNTALFYAVNNNRLDVVKVLLRAGAQTHTVNRQGYTPKQCAMNRNYAEIAELLPAEETPYELPAKYLSYSTFHNFIHGDRVQDPPGYHPDLGMMLLGMGSESKLPVFAQANMDLFHFLILTDDRLRDLGVKYPIERKRILLGLYDFHLHKWSKNSLWTMPKQSTLDFYDILEALENMLKHLTVMHCSLLYTKALTVNAGSNVMPRVGQDSDLNQNLAELHSKVREFKVHINGIHELSSPKPVLHVTAPNVSSSIHRKMCTLASCVILGGMVVYLKSKWFTSCSFAGWKF